MKYLLYTLSLGLILITACNQDEEAPSLTYPIADFDFQLSDTLDPYRVTFENNSQNSISYLWDFGDGNQSTLEAPSHRFELPGTYVIRLDVLSEDSLSDYMRRTFMIPDSGRISFSYLNAGCEVPCEVEFEAYAPQATNVRWDFGDGTQSEETNPIHQYLEHGTYTVRLEADMPGGIQRVSQTLQVYPDGTLPNAKFYYTGGLCTVPCEVSFTNITENATRYEWDFGDGETSLQENPVHTYQFKGVYRIKLKAYNDAGYDEYIQSVEVF